MLLTIGLGLPSQLNTLGRCSATQAAADLGTVVRGRMGHPPGSSTAALSFWGSSHPAVRQLVLPAVNVLHALLLALHSRGDEMGDMAEVL